MTAAIKASPQVFKGNGFSIAGLVCGIVSLILHIISIFSTVEESIRDQYGRGF